MRDIKDRFSELCIDKSLTFPSRATSPFSRGGKGDGAGQRDGGDFTRVVGMEMFGAAGGASSSPTKSGQDSSNAKPYNYT